MLQEINVLWALKIWNGSSAGHVEFMMERGFMAQLGQDIDGEAANDESGTSVSMNAAGDQCGYWLCS